MTEKLVDTHFHLDYYKNHGELYNNINKLEQYTLCMTNSPEIFVSCRNLYIETKYVKFALGFHPQEKSLTAKDFSDFMILLNRTNYVGEVGMDFSSDKYMDKKQQINYFERIVDVCTSKNKLISIHLRKSENEAIKIIKRYCPQKSIIHWFTGSTAQLEELINLNCYFSINSNMVRNKSTKSNLLLIPKNRILVESDGPFSKVGNKKYSPELLPLAYKEISEFLQTNYLIEQVKSNFKELLLKHK